MDRPNPPGWKGGSEDFGFIRTLDGHLSTNVNLEDVGSCAGDRSNVHFPGNDLAEEEDYQDEYGDA